MGKNAKAGFIGHIRLRPIMIKASGISNDI